MINEKGFAAYNALGHVTDDLIMDALLPEDQGATSAPVKEKRIRRLTSFFENGWSVAIICALVAVTVMGGIIWAGNRPESPFPPGGTVAPDTEEEASESLPPLPPSIEDTPNEDRVIGVRDLRHTYEPVKFLAWSRDVTEENGMGQEVTADGLGFYGTMTQSSKMPELPEVSFIKNEELAGNFGISHQRDHIMERVTVYDMSMNEVLTDTVDDDWSYSQCMGALPEGRYYVSLYVTHKEGNHHSCASDYAYLLNVTDSIEITKSCTVKTDRDKYQWGMTNCRFIATLTSTVAGAVLEIDDGAWTLTNLDTGDHPDFFVLELPYIFLMPSSSTDHAWASVPLEFSWETTPPGHYRLTYTGTEPTEGEAYPFYDFEIDDPPLQSDVHTLTFLYCSDTFLRDDYFVEEQHDGGGLSSAIYEREMMVEQAVDLDLLFHDGGDFLNYGDELKTSVLAGDDTYAVVMTHNAYGMTDLMTASILTDLAEMNERQEIHLNAGYWDKTMMEDVSLGGHMYVGYNDFLLPNHHMVVFNQSMYAPYVDTEGNLYDHVRAGDWTLEKMADVAALVGGQNADGETVYGFGSNGGQQLFAFVPAGGVKVVDKKDDGIPYVAGVADNHDQWVSVIEWVYDLCNADNAYDWQENLVSPGQNHTILSSGRVLLSLTSISEYRNLQDRAMTYGVLPYPKYDKAQADYHTLYYGGMLGVTTIVRDTAVVGRTLDLLARHANPVHTAFAETVLGTSAKDAPDDVQMLEIMENTMTSDLIYVAYDDSHGDPLFNCMFRRLTAWNKEQTAEAMQLAAEQYDRYLEKIHKRVAVE